MTRIPLSQSHLRTPWPIAAFNVMSKPGGAGCNLACEYCFYKHNQRSQKPEVSSQNRPGNSPPSCLGASVPSCLSSDLLDHFIAEYIASQDNPTVFFTWQGGEPTLAGLDFYRRVIELQTKHAKPGITIANSIQTNGVLLDDQWCQFLAQNRWPVGISIDGPADMHDAYRHTRSGSGSGQSHSATRSALDSSAAPAAAAAAAPVLPNAIARGSGSFAQVRNAIDLLHQYHVRFDTLTTVTPLNVNRVEEL